MADPQGHHLSRFKGWETQTVAVIYFFFSLSFTLEWHKIIGKAKTCKNALLLKNIENGTRVQQGFELLH